MNTDQVVRQALEDSVRDLPCPEPDLDALLAAGQSLRIRRAGLAVGLAAVVVLMLVGVSLLWAAGTKGAVPEPVPATSPTTRDDTAAGGVSVRTLVKAGELGLVDGSGPDTRFGEITGIAVGPTGTVYVSKYSSVRMVTPGGVVTTLAVGDSTPPTGAVVDWALGFRNIAVGPDGTVYVVHGRETIRAISPDGTNSDVVAGTGSPFSLILGITVDASGTVYVADNGWVRTVTPDGQVSTVGQCAQPTHPGACGELGVDPGGTIHFRTHDGDLVLTMTPDGRVSTVAGGDNGTSNVERSQTVDGGGGQGRFGRMSGFALDPRDSTVYITDSIGLRKVTPDGTVTTIGGSTGLVDEHGARLRGDQPGGPRDPGRIAIGADGTMYAAVPGAILTIKGL